MSTTTDWWSPDILKNKNQELGIESLIEMNLRLRKERQIIEY
jgi:hypothetical protein